MIYSGRHLKSLQAVIGRTRWTVLQLTAQICASVRLPCGRASVVCSVLNASVQIRSHRDTARSRLKEGVNPNDQHRADKVAAQQALEAQLAEHERRQAENLPVRKLFDGRITVHR